jgi:hypothetical protein
MLINEHEHTLAKMRQELTLIETRAKKVSLQFQNLTREMESSKVVLLQKLLEEKMKCEARRRGAASVIKDKRRLQSSILVTAGGFILGGLLTKDGWGALNSGLAGLDGALQGFGRAKWVVLLGKRIVVAASENNPLEGKWLAWDSLKLAMDELRNKALGGEALGNLDDVLSRLEQKRERRFIPVIVVTGQLKPRREPIR